MQMLATISKPSEGRILYQGQDIRKVANSLRARLGYLPQDFGVYDNLTAFEFLAFLGGLKGVRSKQKIMDVLEAVNLHSNVRQQIRTFSGGMKQRLGIAQALVNDPEVLIVDEPTSGLDPEERVRFRTLLATMGPNTLVILSTHIVSDIAAVAGTIVLLNKGTLVTMGVPEDLLVCAAGHVFETMLSSREFHTMRQSIRISSVVQHHDGVQVRYVSHGDVLPGSRCVDPDLEDAYLYLVSEGKAA
jgi:ABC-type multidrug transport system ATPase subunit